MKRFAIGWALILVVLMGAMIALTAQDDPGGENPIYALVTQAANEDATAQAMGCEPFVSEWTCPTPAPTLDPCDDGPPDFATPEWCDDTGAGLETRRIASERVSGGDENAVSVEYGVDFRTSRYESIIMQLIASGALGQ